VKNVFTYEAGCELLLLSSKSHSIVSNKRKKQAISELQQRQEPTSGILLIFGQMVGKFSTIGAIRRNQNHGILCCWFWVRAAKKQKVRR
jgi:hypothetical protein